MQAVGAAVTERVTELHSQAIANTVWGYSQLGYHHMAMFNVIAREVPARINEFRSQEISNLLIGYARFTHLDPVMLEVSLRASKLKKTVIISIAVATKGVLLGQWLEFTVP